MSRVDNTDPVERKVHIEFHCLAVKYGVDVDVIAEIIKDWMDWEERNFIMYSQEVNGINRSSWRG